MSFAILRRRLRRQMCRPMSDTGVMLGVAQNDEGADKEMIIEHQRQEILRLRKENDSLRMQISQLYSQLTSHFK